MKKSIPMGIALSLCAMGTALPAMAKTEITAGADVASVYLFRGADVCDGNAAVSGQLQAAHDSGAYGLIWGSSCSGSSEYDLVVGWGGEFGGVGIDVSLVNYMYPQDDDADEIGDETELIVNLSYMGVGFTMADNIASRRAGDGEGGGNNSYFYYSLDYSYEQFSGTLGWADPDDKGSADTDYIHLDLTYSYNDNLSFTVSKMLDTEDENKKDNGGDYDDDTIFLVSYSIPIDLK